MGNPVLPFFPKVDADVVPPTPTVGMGISIAGVDRSSYYKSRSLRISETLGSRSTCNFQIFDAAGSLSCPVGSEVIVTLDGVTVFSGTIESTDTNFPSMDYTDNAMFMNIRCVDWNQLLDRKLVARSFAAEGQTFGQIVRLIIDEFLADDGVVPGQIQNGGETDYITFQYETVNSCISMMAEAVGYVFYIDYDKQLHFRDRIDVEAPFSLTASDPNYRRITVKENRSQYRNRQYLRGGLEVSPNSRTEEFAGDNDTRTFTVALPVGAEPEVWINRGSTVRSAEEEEAQEERIEREEQAAEEGAEIAEPFAPQRNIPQRIGTGWRRQTVGIDNEDGSEGLKQWTWNVGDDTVTQNSDELVLRAFNLYTAVDSDEVVFNSDRVRIIYRPLIRILARSQDDTEIASRVAVEGGSGIYEALEEDERIIDSLYAKTKVDGLLSQLGRIPKIATIETDQGGIRAGQLQTLTLTKLGLSGSFLIENFTASDRGDETLRYSYKALDGESLGGWQVFFKRLINRGRKFIITEGEAVMLFGDNSDAVTLTDNLPTPDTSNTLGAYTTDAYSVCLVSAGSQIGSSYPATQTYADVIKNSYPSVYYRLDEGVTAFIGGSNNIEDSSGNANAGSSSFTVSSSPGAVGTDAEIGSVAPSRCMLFAGVMAGFESKIAVPAAAVHNQTDMTIGFWLVAIQNAAEMNILNGGATGDLSNIRLVLDANATPTAENTDDISLHYYDTGASATRTVTWTGLSLRRNVALNDTSGGFSHLALVRDQTHQTFELFVNGQSRGVHVTNTAAGAIRMTNLNVESLVVGQKFDSSLITYEASKWLRGRLDEFAIFPSRLSSETIAQHAKDRPTVYHVGSLIPEYLDGTNPPPPTYISL